MPPRALCPTYLLLAPTTPVWGATRCTALPCGLALQVRSGSTLLWASLISLSLSLDLVTAAQSDSACFDIAFPHELAGCCILMMRSLLPCAGFAIMVICVSRGVKDAIIWVEATALFDRVH